MRRPRVSAVAVMFVCAAFAACDDTATGTVEADISGTYILTSVNGMALPFREFYTFFDNNVVLSDSSFTNSGSLVVNSAHTWVITAVFREKVYSGTQVFVDETRTDGGAGSWTLSGNSLSLVHVENGVTTTIPATLSGKTIFFTINDTIRTSATATSVRPHVLLFTKP